MKTLWRREITIRRLCRIQFSMVMSVVCFIVCCLCSKASAGVKNLGLIGRVYAIAEQDALQEIKAKAAGIDWEKLIRSKQNLEKIRRFRPDGIPKLPRVGQDRTFEVDMTYRLEFDIPDGKGGILYPAGYTFNPLDYVDYPRTLVIIDAEDPDQMAWLTKSGHVGDSKTRILITGGVYDEVRSRLKRHVFFAMPELLKRLHVRAVPSVIRRNKDKMEVKEIALADSKK